MKEMSVKDVARILDKTKQTVDYTLLQTSPENREDLKQHLYLVVLKTLQNNTFKEPRGLLK